MSLEMLKQKLKENILLHEVTTADFKLLGDYDPNGLHFSRKLARYMGFKEEIAHGVLSLTLGVKKIFLDLGEEEDREVVGLKAVFKSPVYMDDTLSVVSAPSNGTKDAYDFVCYNQHLYNGGEVTVGHAVLGKRVYNIIKDKAEIERIQKRLEKPNLRKEEFDLSVGDYAMVQMKRPEKVEDSYFHDNQHVIDGKRLTSPLVYVSAVLGSTGGLPGIGTVFGNLENVYYYKSLNGKSPWEMGHTVDLELEVVDKVKLEKPIRHLRVKDYRYRISFRVYDISGIAHNEVALLSEGIANVFIPQDYGRLSDKIS